MPYNFFAQDIRILFEKLFVDCLHNYNLVVSQSDIHSVKFGKENLKLVLAISDPNFILLTIIIDDEEFKSFLFRTLFDDLILRLANFKFDNLNGEFKFIRMLEFYREIVAYICENRLYINLYWKKEYLFWLKIGELFGREKFEMDEEYIEIKKLYHKGDLSYRPMILNYFNNNSNAKDLFVSKYLLNNDWVEN